VSTCVLSLLEGACVDTVSHCTACVCCWKALIAALYSRASAWCVLRGTFVDLVGRQKDLRLVRGGGYRVPLKPSLRPMRVKE